MVSRPGGRLSRCTDQARDGEILFRAATRSKISLTLTANQTLHVPPSPFIRRVQVPAGFDVADNEIVKRVSAGDLVISSDLPLAADEPERKQGICRASGSFSGQTALIETPYA